MSDPNKRGFGMPDVPLHGKLVQSQISYMALSRFGKLRFPQPLEDCFESDLAVERSRRLWAEGWLLAGMYCLFLLGDFRAIPGQHTLIILIRCGVTMPCLIAANELLRHNPRKILREGSVVIAAGVVSCSNFFLYHNMSPAISAAAQIGILLSLLGTNVVMRIRFPYAVCATVLCVVSDAVFLALDAQLSTVEKFSLGTPVLLGAFFILLANYSIERGERLSYLLNLRNDIQSEELISANIELERLSSRDVLTGLANRAAFERHFERLWGRAVETNTPLSVVMIDIDHFKIVNDTQGHLYGDEVIRRVAVLIRESLRGEDDFAARFGGEEFVLLLPNTNLEAARKVAERARSLVELAGSPAPVQKLEPGLWTTVSCGIATANCAVEQDREELLLAADAALYEAKGNGRNCVAPAAISQKVDIPSLS